MAKLTSAQRKNLPADQFGLPEERAFPMPDEAHVRLAIAYFHTCPPNKRKELASNINRIAKSYNMKVKLKKHSAFRPYADPEIIEENINIPDIDFPHVIMDEFRYFNDSKTIKDKEYYKKLDNAIHKITECYFDTEYLSNGRLNHSALSDFIYDKDFDMCCKISKKISCCKPISGYMMNNIKSVRFNYLLHDAFAEVKRQLGFDLIEKLFDDIDAMLTSHNDFIRSLDELDDYIKSDMYDPDKWNSYGLSKQYLTNDSVFRTSNFKNFSEYEIYLIDKNKKLIKSLCDAISRHLIKKCGYPFMNNRHNLFLDIEEMHRRGIIDGFYTCENANSFENLDFNTIVKKDNFLYVPIHVYRTEERSIITMAKIYDLKSDKYYYELMDKWLRSRGCKIPKIDVKRITFKQSGVSLFEAFEGIDIDYEGDIYYSKNIDF